MYGTKIQKGDFLFSIYYIYQYKQLLNFDKNCNKNVN